MEKEGSDKDLIRDDKLCDFPSARLEKFDILVVKYGKSPCILKEGIKSHNHKVKHCDILQSSFKGKQEVMMVSPK